MGTGEGEQDAVPSELRSIRRISKSDAKLKAVFQRRERIAVSMIIGENTG